MLHLGHPPAQVAWQRLRQCLDDDVAVEGEVVGTNRGGIIVEVRKERKQEYSVVWIEGASWVVEVRRLFCAGRQLVGRATSLAPDWLNVTQPDGIANMHVQVPAPVPSGLALLRLGVPQ